MDGQLSKRIRRQVDDKDRSADTDRPTDVSRDSGRHRSAYDGGVRSDQPAVRPDRTLIMSGQRGRLTDTSHLVTRRSIRWRFDCTGMAIGGDNREPTLDLAVLSAEPGLAAALNQAARAQEAALVVAVTGTLPTGSGRVQGYPVVVRCAVLPQPRRTAVNTRTQTQGPVESRVTR